jgi:DMSO/TMAO reductase YedYZ molybdopterin-dependent catalytic subunit
LAAGLGLAACRSRPKDAVFAGTLEFSGEGSPPMDAILGSELDGRLYTDLATLKPGSLITPVPEFYIRTRASKLLRENSDWRIHVRGRRSTSIAAADLIRSAKPIGPKLMECAGNTRGTHFGMISVAQWDGVPVSSLFAEYGISGRVLISGFDQYASDSRTSTPGASWIFSCTDLLDSAAFLATAMNGQPLTRDHGAPIRLVVPGWYGCCCIKWVNEIAMTDDRAEVTTQMTEYAQRTHQRGSPKMVAEYEPAMIDSAAMPVRIEKWIAGREIRYLIAGISWGGTRAARSLEIQRNPDGNFTPVDISPDDALPWRLWTHWWIPRASGRYVITMRVVDPGVRTRRLDLGYYARTVEIV